MDLYAWAFEVSRDCLESALPQRWVHVQGVARQARSLRSVSGDDSDVLESAAILHDIGYAPNLVRTGFHPLDGAEYLASIDTPTRVVDLVGTHSYAALEAKLRGLEAEQARYFDEGGVVRDALWYCDLTTTPYGDVVDARERIGEIQRRYGPEHIVTDFITRAASELLAAVDRTVRRCSEVADLS